MLSATCEPATETAVQYGLSVPDGGMELGALTGILAEAGVNLAGVLATSADGRTALKFVAGPARGLKRRLEKAGYTVQESRVFRLSLAPRSKSLHRIAAELSSRGINILSCYGHDFGSSIELILEVDRPDEAASVIAGAR